MSDGAAQTPASSAAQVQKDLLSTSQCETLYPLLHHNIPNAVALGDRDSVQAAAEARGSVSADVSESLDTHSMTKTDGL